jgi:formamidopyrimidine-DNA glycosylase
MPELPEVETYIRDLTPLLHGRQVASAQVRWPRTIAAPEPDTFVQRISGQRFVNFGRRAKYMLLSMDSGDTLIVHLRMTGHLLLQPGNIEPDAHTHVVLGLDDGRQLHFQDARKFGRIWLTSDPASVLARLGPEPLDASFLPETLGRKIAGRKAPIKNLLLDQTILAGVGNIYADEALHLAGIHPARPGGGLTAEELARLHRAIQDILGAALGSGGSSLGNSNVQNYVRPGGEPGAFQTNHRVYQRTGQPCLRCGSPIERLVIGQRSAHFCPTCQAGSRE